MKTAVLTSGPRGAGKTTFVDFVRRTLPDVELVSRDLTMKKILGKTSFTRGSNDEKRVLIDTCNQLENILLPKNTRVRVIVEFWNETSLSRKNTIKTFRDMGADKVICWQFLTPVAVAKEWYFKKPFEERQDPSFRFGFEKEYAWYHSEATNIENDGFDSIHKIDPSVSGAIDMESLFV